MEVTTIIDIALKEAVAEPETGGKSRRTGGTVKGSGTTYFNTVITSAPTIIDAKTLLETSLKVSRNDTVNIPNTASADGDILINDTAVASVNGTVDNEETAREGDGPSMPTIVSNIAMARSR